MADPTLQGNGEDCPACALRRDGDPWQERKHPCNLCNDTGRIARPPRQIVEETAAEARRTHWATRQWWLDEQEVKNAQP